MFSFVLSIAALTTFSGTSLLAGPKALLSCNQDLTNTTMQATRLDALVKRQKKEDYGPNCYAVALYGLYPEASLRYVSKGEMTYLLSRDFEEISTIERTENGFQIPKSVQKGDLFVFDNKEHVATYWGQEKVVDTRGPEYHYGFRLIDVNNAHTGVSPPPGTNISDFGMYREASPFRTVKVYRFKESTRRNTEATNTVSNEKKTLLDHLSETFFNVIRHRADHRQVVPKIVIDTAREILAIESRNDAKNMENLLRLEAMAEWYDGYYQKRFFSSIYATEEKVLQQVGSQLRTDPNSADFTALATMVWKAYGSNAITNAAAVSAMRKIITERLQQAPRDKDLSRISLDLVAISRDLALTNHEHK